MITADITIDRDLTIGAVPRRLFGTLVEHMGRCVYTGIYEPGHLKAEQNGYRTDVLDLVKELGTTVVRYPGGNFVSGYRWEDGVGPAPTRPRRLDGAWHSIETNAFGLHEFVRWAGLAGVEVMEAVNLGTRGVNAARSLVEYANHPSGTALSDLRRKNGSPEPFDIRLWELGNEMDGPWQIGHKTASEYGRLALEAGKAMRLVDPSIELVVCGSSGIRMPTFGEWERTVLEHTYEIADYISLHAYYEEKGDDASSFLASAVEMDQFIEGVVATVDAVRALKHAKKRVDLAFDEWNVWYQTTRHDDDQPAAVSSRGEWAEHPRLIEDRYSVTDAVVVGTLLNTLLRHCDRVAIANLAQLVNVIAPIRSEEGGPAWRQTTFWPFAQMASLARGQSMLPAVRSDPISTERYGDVDAVDVSSTWDKAGGNLTLFLANRSLDQEARISVALRGLSAGMVVRGEVLTIPQGADRHASNDEGAQSLVAPRPLHGVSAEGDTVTLTVPALSWVTVELTAAVV